MFSFSEHSQTSRVLTFFREYEKRSDFYVCKICEKDNGVAKPLSGKSKPNLRSHMLKSHPKLFVEFCAPLKKFPLAKKRLEMLQSFAEIITVNGRPFESLVDCGFQRLIKSDLELLSDGGMPINFSHNFQELKEFIADIALNIENQIMKDLKNRHIAIMMDIGSKNNKSLLGISSQCIIDGEVVIHSLGVIPLDSSHTASFIQQKLLECLDGFGIQSDLLISLTTDNARNMIATINNLNEHLKEQGTFDVPESSVIYQQMDLTLRDDISYQLNQQEIEEIYNQVADNEELERISMMKMISNNYFLKS